VLVEGILDQAKPNAHTRRSRPVLIALVAGRSLVALAAGSYSAVRRPG